MHSPTTSFPTRAMPATTRALGFSEDEWTALLVLRARYRRYGDLFDRRERARLAFVRWLVETGRLQP